MTALIGPSGCGKSTLLRIFNRIYALYPKLEARGEVLLDGENILSPKYPMNRLRSKVGMVFQKPVPFPMTIFENVAYGIRHHEKLSKADMADRVEQALRRGTGARGLRAILEEVLLNTMYELPGRTDVGSVLITAETVATKVIPTLTPREPAAKRPRRQAS